uniref:Retrovirus-related Pol polyprotein from transposon TNT 1-94 n=1 Tax=Quercus lobata TaxID=97700 RepID=A0A7N2LRD3_QUELO
MCWLTLVLVCFHTSKFIHLNNAAVVSLGVFSGSLYTNSNWFAFEDDRVANECSTSSLASPSPKTKVTGVISGGSDNNVIVGEDDDLVDTVTSSPEAGAILEDTTLMLCGGAIAWKSKKQECVAQSTMEAEYIALNATAKEGVYLKQFLIELLIVECVQRPIPILCDNNSAIAITKDSKCHSRAKHIDGRYHYIQDMIKKKKVVVQKVSSKQNLADPFTKGLSSRLFETHVLEMGLC